MALILSSSCATSLQRYISPQPFHQQIHKRPHLRRGLPPLTVQHMDRQRCGFEFDQQSLECSGREMAGDLVGHQSRDAEPLQCGLNRGVVVAHGQARADLHVDAFLAAAEAPIRAGRNGIRGDDGVMRGLPCQVVRGLQFLFAFQIFR